MQIQPLAHMLEDLLREASDEGLEICLAEADAASTDLVALRAEYAQRYERALASVVEERGAPQFSGERGQAGWPSWLRCERATCWACTEGVIYVGLAAEPSTLRLVAGSRPHAVGGDTITLYPPPV